MGSNRNRAVGFMDSIVNSGIFSVQYENKLGFEGREQRSRPFNSRVLTTCAALHLRNLAETTGKIHQRRVLLSLLQ